MKKIIIFTSAVLLGYSSALSQVTIGSDITLTATGGVQIILSDLNLNNSGKINAGKSTFNFTGVASNALTGNGNAITFNSITINKTAGRLFKLNSPVTITSKLNFISGNIELSSQVINLDSTGSLVDESKISHITGTQGGSVHAFKILNAPNAIDIGNLGAIISSTQNLGIVEVTRKHEPVNLIPKGSKSLSRTYTISTGAASVDGVLTFHYFDAETNGIGENLLSQFRSNDGINYTNVKSYSRDTTANFVTQKEYATLNYIYTLGSNNQVAGINPGSNDSLLQNVVKEKGNRGLTQFKIMPNPVIDIARVTLGSNSPGKGNLLLLNAAGQQIMQQAISFNQTNSQYQLNMARLPQGIYNLVFSQDGAPVKTARVLKR